MQTIERILDWLDRVAHRANQRRVDAFLAEATSLADLENRVRRLGRSDY